MYRKTQNPKKKSLRRACTTHKVRVSVCVCLRLRLRLTTREFTVCALSE